MFRLTIEGATTTELKARLLSAAQEIGGASVGSGSTDKPAPKAAAAPKPQEKAAPAIDFKKDVASLVLQLAEKSRDKAIAILGEFGVAKATELKPEQYAEFIVKMKAAIEAPDELV